MNERTVIEKNMPEKNVVVLGGERSNHGALRETAEGRQKQCLVAERVPA